MVSAVPPARKMFLVGADGALGPTGGSPGLCLDASVTEQDRSSMLCIRVERFPGQQKGCRTLVLP